ncbi:MAG: hypothetical protein IT526_04190, partial [Nitrosomonas sp.]|nr:hypothetical protein [Nitrosomonas sp.]
MDIWLAVTRLPAVLVRWVDINLLSLGREMRLSYLPPLMVYVAAGISSLTGIVGTFYVKERLGLSAEFLAALGFWMALPWALKMPLGHLVDLMWRWKSLLVYLGAGLIAANLFIMIGLLGHDEAMCEFAPLAQWYVLASLLAPIGYVLQDVVADAMTVEAVPRVEADGQLVDPEKRKQMHITMQTLGRVAIIGGGILVAVANVILMKDVAILSEADKAAAYLLVYELALVIPLVSVCGIWLAGWLKQREIKHFSARGLDRAQIDVLTGAHVDAPPVNWWILGGGLAFTIISLGVGIVQIPGAEEIIFCLSMGIVLFLIRQLTAELESEARNVLVGTALLVFVFRAIPSPGAGSTWWMIDELGFDQQFMATLSL